MVPGSYLLVWIRVLQVPLVRAKSLARGTDNPRTPVVICSFRETFTVTASAEGEFTEGVTYVGQGLVVAGVVELVGQQYCPPLEPGRDPDAGAGEAVVDPDVLFLGGTRSWVPEQAACGHQSAALHGQGLADSGGAESCLGGFSVGIQHVSEESGELVDGGEDAGDAADPAQETGVEVVGSALEVSAGVLRAGGRRW
jgi:hypothetical protein